MFPHGKLGAIPVWAGVLYRFAYEIQVGDIIIYPYKPDSTLFFGKVTGGYEYDSTAEFHRNRRRSTGYPRRRELQFSQPALNEIGSAVTVFRVKNHAAEFEHSLLKDGRATSNLRYLSAPLALRRTLHRGVPGLRRPSLRAGSTSTRVTSY